VPLTQRTSGVLLHPSSLPGSYGIGDLGAEARGFVDFLASARQSWWQMLPVVPPSVGASPYTAVSAFATNPLLIDLTELVAEGLLTQDELAAAELPASPRVDFGAVHQKKHAALRRAFERFSTRSALKQELDNYAQGESAWLEDYALFSALHAAHGDQPWTEWPEPLRDRAPAALKKAKKEHAAAVEFHKFTQWLFDRQWAKLRAYCQSRGVALMGDLPIFVAMDSADVWANRRAFQLGKDGKPEWVAGVPPDYFTEDGQLWGNPLYDWAALRERGYDWWVQRFRNAFRRFDSVRVDHFIGFYRAWHVSSKAATAKEGHFAPGPKAELFERVEKELGKLPIVAEDLGVIVPEIWALRDQLGFPGMRVLQFGFGDIERGNEHLPHTYVKNAVAYTGTHDNDTITGWYQSLDAKVAEGGKEAGFAAAQREHVWRYLGGQPERVHWAMIRLVQMSVANTAIFPVQDLLGLGSSARMNVPGVAGGNWGFRLQPHALDGDPARILGELTTLFGRQRKA
jgi:4-alpha-glucanotransferase